MQYILVDPNTLDQCSDKNQLDYISYSMENEIGKAKVIKAMEKLPPREADIVDLYYFNKKYQIDIAKMFSITQGDVSYRLSKAKKRLQFLMDFPELDIELMRKDLLELFPDELDSDGINFYWKIAEGMYRTSSQSAVAKEMDIFQGRVRYRFLKILEFLNLAVKMGKTKYIKYLEVFDMLAKNPNILRELKIQPRWQNKFHDTILS